MREYTDCIIGLQQLSKKVNLGTTFCIWDLSAKKDNHGDILSAILLFWYKQLRLDIELS